MPPRQPTPILGVLSAASTEALSANYLTSRVGAFGWGSGPFFAFLATTCALIPFVALAIGRCDRCMRRQKKAAKRLASSTAPSYVHLSSAAPCASHDCRVCGVHVHTSASEEPGEGNGAWPPLRALRGPAVSARAASEDVSMPSDVANTEEDAVHSDEELSVATLDAAPGAATSSIRSDIRSDVANAEEDAVDTDEELDVGTLDAPDEAASATLRGPFDELARSGQLPEPSALPPSPIQHSPPSSAAAASTAERVASPDELPYPSRTVATPRMGPIAAPLGRLALAGQLQAVVPAEPSAQDIAGPDNAVQDAPGAQACAPAKGRSRMVSFFKQRATASAAREREPAEAVGRASAEGQTERQDYRMRCNSLYSGSL